MEWKGRDLCVSLLGEANLESTRLVHLSPPVVGGGKVIGGRSLLMLALTWWVNGGKNFGF